ncbi:M20/M25/M40 family metallo-hydrolase [Conexibacter woesei]|uniref:Peptidase M20 n=1 Tax=Conexibacter woesei (strain DSM 14684 / CCUG 47730 / CIP 108061 / JCM 11494 / NBRC 100937 / ID131577) TaxID=469383 RepID=D3FAR2_CONWI|nr:M20/M25/M40 family metallo-hydrolase [Conexibacter woesei]ADB51225.1 peptidase M20 [Conexibacter woesei DSM 14684]
MTAADRTTVADLTPRALAVLDAGAIERDLCRLVRVPSPTGDERAALELLGELCTERGIDATLHEHDVAALRLADGYPGEEAGRSELLGLTADVAGHGGARLCLAGHLDVVDPGAAEWTHGPWSGAVVDGAVHGRGAVDMKGGVVAALHAIGAVRDAAGADGPPCDLTLLGLSSEEDGGLGAFAQLARDDRFDGCVIPEPTDFRVIAAHGGALTFTGEVGGVSAHAAFRLAGVSAIDRYLPIHGALAELEQRLNRDVSDPLMAQLELPYPLSVGRVQAGRWSSQVPDRLEFEGRVGVPVGSGAAEVRKLVESTVQAAAGDGPPVRLRWTGGQFGAGATPVEHPLTQLVARSLGAETSPQATAAPIAGISYGADMRLFTERGIPCVLAGPGPSRLAHAVDEHVLVADVLRTARMLVRTIAGFGAVAR